MGSSWLTVPLLMDLIVHVAGPLSQGVPSSFVQLNKRYTFPYNARACVWAEWKKILPNEHTFATYQKQICSTRDGFDNDFACEGNQLHLKEAKYTDRGTYMFICDGAKQSVKLDVLYAINVNVTQMDSITLHCYHADDTKDVTWLRNNEKVVHYKRDGSVSTGRGFEGRASVEKSSFNTGCFSLTITAVKQTDAGLYRCFVDDGTTKGDPHAHLLHVNEKRSSPETDQTDSIYRELIIYKTITAVLVCGIVLFGIIFGIYKLWCFIPRPATDQYTSPTAAPVIESVPMRVISPTDDRQPVQESDTAYTGDKSSSTRPIFNI